MNSIKEKEGQFTKKKKKRKKGLIIPTYYIPLRYYYVFACVLSFTIKKESIIGLVSQYVQSEFLFDYAYIESTINWCFNVLLLFHFDI